MPQLPPVTKALMLICTVMLCLQSLAGYWVETLFALWPLGSGPFMPWQLLTYAFLHGGVAHLFFNMLGLWMFGAEIEGVWGRTRYLQFLAASALTGGLVQLLTTSLGVTGHGPTLGASGALYGLLLAYVMVFPRREFDLVGFLPMLLAMIPGQIFSTVGMVLFFLLLTNRQAVPIPPIPVPAKVMVLIFGGTELFQGVFFGTSGVAHFAHLGGMLGGWLMIRYWRGLPPFPPKARRR